MIKYYKYKFYKLIYIYIMLKILFKCLFLNTIIIVAVVYCTVLLILYLFNMFYY